MRFVPPSIRSARRVGGAVVLALAMIAAPAAVTSAAAADGAVQCPSPSPVVSPAPTGRGVGITALVCGPTAAPSGTGTAGPASSGGLPASVGSGASSGIRGGSSSGGGTGAPSTVTPSSPAGVTLVDSVDLGGILSIGGLSTGSAPSLNPFGGEAQVWFTVRNMSKSSIDLTVDFWMENVLGLRLSNVDGVAVPALKPGETRTVGADLPGAGQWTVLTAHARVNPPAQVEGTALSPVTRDATVFVLPWLVVLLLGVGAAAVVVVSLIRRAGGTPLPVTVGA